MLSQVYVGSSLKNVYNAIHFILSLNLACHSVDTSVTGCEKHTTPPHHCAWCPFELLMTSHPGPCCEFHPSCTFKKVS